MTKTLALNAGSSSLKFQLFVMPEETVIAKGLVERIGLADSIFAIKYGTDQKFEEVSDIATHDEAVEKLLHQLLELRIIDSYDEITGIGHRVVAGGEIFKDSALVDEEALQHIEALAEFAPLHNPAEARVIRAFNHVLPNAASVAVFDTSFHTTMPEKAYLYSIPMSYYHDYGARKYGAHGTSHRYVARRAAELLQKPLESLKIITCHLGNGASITAVDGGRSVDTSMGFTPLAGITMGTRSGDIDASLVAYLMKKTDTSNIDEFLEVLNKKSGLLGLSGVSSDMREVMAAAESGNHDAQMAYEVFINRIQKYIGSYVAVMNGVDAIVFTAGIGENAKEVRRDVIEGLTWFGCHIDHAANDMRGIERIISTPESTVAVVNVPTDEEVEIAREVERLRTK